MRTSRLFDLVALLLPLAIFGVWQVPRAATPTEMPALVLPRAEVDASLRADDSLAALAPSDELEEARRALYLEEGRAEVRGGETIGAASARAERLVIALVALADADGDEVVAAVRMADVLRMEAALGGEGTAAERAGEMGGWPASLERWGALEGRRRVAPRLVIRALAIARWNAVFLRPLTEGMSPLCERAYHGWLALHATSASTPLRLEALDAYAALGGTRALEARAVLLAREGDHHRAEALFREAYEHVGSLRLRNLALGALERSAAEPEPSD